MSQQNRPDQLLDQFGRWINLQSTRMLIYLLCISLVELVLPVIFVQYLRGWELTFALAGTLAVVMVMSWIFVTRFAATYQDIEDGLGYFTADSNFRFDVENASGYDAKYMQTRLNALFSQIAEAESVNSELIRNISHEIKTPLTSMMIMVEGIEDGVFEANQENLKVISDAAKRIDETLAVIKKYADLNALNLTPGHDLPKAVEDASEQARISLFGQGVEVIYDRVDDKEMLVYAGTGMLPTLFDVLTSNAVEHAIGMTSLRYEVAAAYNPISGRDMLRVSIEDDGCGIEEDKLSRVRNPFYKADESHTRSETSSAASIGLGLPMADKIMTALGGMMELKSENGNGTTVVLWFPDDENPVSSAKQIEGPED